MSENLKSIVFALSTAVVCSLLLTVAAQGLNPLQQENAAVDQQKNILKSVGLIAADRAYTAEDIERLYAENIRCIRVDENGNVVTSDAADPPPLPVYLYRKDSAVAAYIIPIDSRGLWGRIHGYLALAADGATIAGFTVYKHSETPGLGGEIEKRWFQDNFKGKKIVDRQGHFTAISIVKQAKLDTLPAAERINAVDGISGATLTGRFLSAGLKHTLSEYEPVSIKFRTNRLLHLPADAEGCETTP